MDKKDKSDLGNLDETDLLIIIGRELALSEHLALPISRTEAVRRAKEWLSVKLTELKAAICQNKKVQSFAQKSENRQLVTAIADLISSICVGVSPITVSYLLVNRGIKSLCSRYRDE